MRIVAEIEPLRNTAQLSNYNLDNRTGFGSLCSPPSRRLATSASCCLPDTQWPSGREHFVCTTFTETRRGVIAVAASLKSPVSETREGIRRRHAVVACTGPTFAWAKTTAQGVSAPGATSALTKRFIGDRRKVRPRESAVSCTPGQSDARVTWYD